jgi:radical SAM protein with 4Fe4S-binding SPASM domain
VLEASKLLSYPFVAPINVNWELTLRCNLNCIHCYNESGRQQRGELTTSEALDLIEEIARMKVFILQFTGGEPLLRKDFWQLARHAKQVGLFLVLLTNGTLIDESAGKQIKSIGFKEVRVSLDGASPTTHDFFRGTPGCFEKTIAGIQTLLRKGVPVTIASMISRVNFQEAPEIIRLAQKLGVKHLRIGFCTMIGRSTGNGDMLTLSREQIKGIILYVNRRAKELAGELEINSFNDILGYKNEPICSAGKAFCVVTPEGDVLPCPLLPRLKFSGGNLRKLSLEEAWQSEIFKFIRSLNPENFDLCKDCSKVSQCGGGCRARAYATYGSIHAPDPICRRNIFGAAE